MQRYHYPVPAYRPVACGVPWPMWLGIRAPGPSCEPGHVSTALLPIYHAPLVWQVMHAHGGGSISGNELVLERSQNDIFLEVLTGTMIMTLDEISKAHVCSERKVPHRL